ncbi:hypothetical protein ING2E5A_0680 [Petrimonas mucosa]|uniref:Uncharacterized protein n=1 Tax=Petrimonas mucosa TaxID=1642646 RepID=A0A1G4G4P6_9BACT|nr:hypothetical protein ING2E5A_0680 [Petrimonas mucosa]
MAYAQFLTDLSDQVSGRSTRFSPQQVENRTIFPWNQIGELIDSVHG